MSWENFYLVCFLVGFTLSLLSFFAGIFDLHLPGLGHGHHHLGHVHLPHVGDAHAAGHVAGHGDSGGISPFNFSTLMAFLAWFGGAGYLFTAVFRWWAVLAFLAAVAAGTAGAAIVFLFLAKVLLRTDQSLDDADFDPIGILGRISSSIAAGGTGEMVYSQGGTRHTCAARSETGAAIAKGAEVVVTRFERGIAYVRLWDELAESVSAADTDQSH